MSLEDNIRALERAPLLAEAGTDALRLLAFSSETLKLKENERLFARGDAARCGYAVVRGRIRLDADGGPVTVGPGAVIGEMALLVDTTRPCDAYALEPVQLMAIPRSQFLRVLEEFPGMAAMLRGKIAARVRSELAALHRIQGRLDRLSPSEE